MAIELDPRSLPRIWVVRVEEAPPTVYGTMGGREIPLTASLPVIRYEVHIGPHSFPMADMTMTKFGDWVRIAAHIPDASILSPGLRGRSGVLYIQETYSSSDASPVKVLTHTSYFFHPDPDPDAAPPSLSDMDNYIALWPDQFHSEAEADLGIFVLTLFIKRIVHTF